MSCNREGQHKGGWKSCGRDVLSKSKFAALELSRWAAVDSENRSAGLLESVMAEQPQFCMCLVNDYSTSICLHFSLNAGARKLCSMGHSRKCEELVFCVDVFEGNLGPCSAHLVVMGSDGGCQSRGHGGGHAAEEIGLGIHRERIFTLIVVGVAFVHKDYLWHIWSLAATIKVGGCRI